MPWTITIPTSQIERSKSTTCKPLSMVSSQMDKLESQSISMMTFHSNSKICCLEISWQIFFMPRSSKMISKSEMKHHFSSLIFSQVGLVSWPLQHYKEWRTLSRSQISQEEMHSSNGMSTQLVQFWRIRLKMKAVIMVINLTQKRLTSIQLPAFWDILQLNMIS